MILGRKGMGKSTTADKLILADSNTEFKRDIHYDTIYEDNYWSIGGFGIWLLKSKVDEKERIRALSRLKHLSFFLGLENPHTELNLLYNTRDKFDSSTSTEPQLISNEMTVVRILDVPGFFGEDYSTLGLAIMREVLRIQSAMRMNFRRVLYFIPKRGALDRDNYMLQMDLRIMTHYFGKSIFDCMVLIATVSPDVYEYLPPGAISFTKNDKEMTQKYFQRSLSSIFQGECLPDRKPPIIFISMNDTCEEVFTKIKNAPVIFDGIRLTYEHGTCTHCGIKIKLLKQGIETVRIACYAGDDPSLCIPYEDSFCHPMMKSKYWGITKLLGGIYHTITRRKFLGFFPDYHNPDDEICVVCGFVTGSHGCRAIGTHFKVKSNQLLVDHHLYTASEPIVVEDSQHIYVPDEDKHNTVEQADHCENRPKIFYLEQKFLKCDHNGVQYSMKDYGMTLIVPKGSVATGEEIHMEIGVTLYGPFNFPMGTRPISPILSVRLVEEKTLAEPFQLHVILRHILGELTELKARHHQIQFCCSDFISSDPNSYKFHPNDGGLISQSFTSSYGLIITRKFCIFCMIAADTSELQSEIGYRLTKVICTSELKNEAYLYLSYDAYLQVCSLEAPCF